MMRSTFAFEALENRALLSASALHAHASRGPSHHAAPVHHHKAPKVTQRAVSVPRTAHYRHFSAIDPLYEIQIPNVNGTSTLAGFTNDVEAESFSFSLTRADVRASAIPSVVTFTKQVDKATPILFEYAANGKILTPIVVSVLTPAGNKFVLTEQYTFDSASFTGEGVSGTTAAIPTETVTFGFTGLVTYKAYLVASDGSLKGTVVESWNFQTNSAT